MKALVFLLFLLPAVTGAQNNSNIENAMTKFQRFYNAGQGDSINAMFGHNWDKAKAIKPLWTNEDSEATLQQYGTLQSFTFIGIDKSDPQKVYVFKTVFTKGGEKTTSLTLDKNNDLATFRFITTSGGISRLLKKHNYTRKRQVLTNPAAASPLLVSRHAMVGIEVVGNRAVHQPHKCTATKQTSPAKPT